MTVETKDRLRIAMVAGCLGVGGAEKQLVLAVRSLREAGVDVKVYSLTQGESHESCLQQLGLAPVWLGRHRVPRLFRLSKEVLQFRPHVIQAGHTFANFYVGLVGRLLQVISLGAMRTELAEELSTHGSRRTRLLIRLPHVLLTNSETALHGVRATNLKKPSCLFHLANAISLRDHDSSEDCGETNPKQSPQAIFVGNLVPNKKRLDIFLRALSMACKRVPTLTGTIVGDGPERKPMEKLARELGFAPDQVTFLGQRKDVPELLRRADMLVLCSDWEGTPNVVLEAMATRLPVTTTPAGDAAKVVQDGVTGYVVPFGDVEAMADCMVRLAECSDLRHRFGEAGRRVVEANYSYETLAKRLLLIYRKVAEQRNNDSVRRVVESHLNSMVTQTVRRCEQETLCAESVEKSS